jgi:hypothetical protein
MRSPVAGKTVAVWSDHDEAGARYADAVIPKLIHIGAKVRRVTVPQDKPKKWDAADAVTEGFDVEELLRSSRPVADAVQPLDITCWRAADRFVGEPQFDGGWSTACCVADIQTARIGAQAWHRAGRLSAEHGRRH